MRYAAEWVGYATGPWIVRDLATGRAYRKPHKSFFWHGDFDTAVKMADALNR